jgi:hypothetical protein
MFVFDDGRRYWMSTSRTAFKTRAVDARPAAALLLNDECVAVTVDRFDWTRPGDWVRGTVHLPSTAFGMVGYGAAGAPYALWYLRDARDVPEQWRVWSRTLLRATPRPHRGSASPVPTTTPPPDTAATDEPHDPDLLARLVDVAPGVTGWPAAVAWRGADGAPRMARASVTVDPSAGTLTVSTTRDGAPAGGVPVTVVFDGSSGHRAADMAGATVEGVTDGITGGTADGTADASVEVAITRGWYWVGWDHRSV